MCKIQYITEKIEDYEYLARAIEILLKNYKIDCKNILVSKKKLSDKIIIIIRAKNKFWPILQVYTKIKHNPNAKILSANLNNNSCLLQINKYKFDISN